MKFPVLFASLGLALSPTSAVVASDTIVTLGKPRASSILQIGVVPEEKPVELDLGTLRTGETKLPHKSTYRSRLRMRGKRIIERQKPASEIEQTSASKTPPSDIDFQYSDMPDGFVPPED